MSTPIYLDHNATTPVCSEVLMKLPELGAHWGNPSSIHKVAREPKAILRETRKNFAEFIHAHPLELIFTSGGSESNNLAIKGIFYSLQKLGRTHFITSSVEHPSIMKTFEFLQKLGATIDYIPVDRQGQLDLEFFEQKLSEKTALVSVMTANNETGAIFPIEKLCALAQAKGAYFHTDAVQALGKMNLNLEKWNVDLASFSAHKFYSLKGCGVLYQKRGTPLEALIHGGGQERGRRAGTENILAIGALGQMVSGDMTALKNKISVRNETIQKLRNNVEKEILSHISDVEILCQSAERLANTSSLLIDGVDGETLLMNLDMHGICISTGAACSSGSQEPSPVLRAMGLSRNEAQMTLRLSLGWQNTPEQMEYFLDTLKKVVARIRNFSTIQNNKKVL